MKLSKITAFALTATLACVLAVPAFAEVTPAAPADKGNAGGQTALYYTEDNFWVVSIPASVTLSTKNDVVADPITASKMNIQPDKVLHVSVKESADPVTGLHAGEVTLTNTNDSTGALTATTTVSLDGTNKLEANAVVATFTGEDTGVKSGGTLHYAQLRNDLRAGTYTATVDFLIETAVAKG